LLKSNRVLFISHDASRTGAPIVLLHFLRWIRSNTQLDFEILFRRGGPLEADFAEVAPITVLGRSARLTRRLTAAWQVHHLKQRAFRVIYSNTITNGRLVSQLNGSGSRVITHVHELESWIRRSGMENLRLVKEHTSRFIACAGAVKTNLVERHAVDATSIDIVHGFVPTMEFDAAASGAARARVRAELGISERALVIGASGTLDWRKGPDLFIQLARRIHQKQPGRDVHFVWLGGAGPTEERLWELAYDARIAGVERYVHFLGSRPAATTYFHSFDIFALVSREDPFPLVCLEVASIGKPILCFDGAGGEREFVEGDCGFVVPYLDIDAMAAKTVELLDSDQLRVQLGMTALCKVTARHSLSVAAPRLFEIIEQSCCN
jgi:glycosyltransferase involved in cell wall biosynthesis